MRASSNWFWRIASLVLVLVVGLCGRDHVEGRGYPSLMPEVSHHLALPARGGARHFVVEIALPSGYDHFGMEEIGNLTWVRDRSPQMNLAINPSKLDETKYFDSHQPCRYPDLELPAVHGTQLACVGSSGYHVVRYIVWGEDVLRCSVLSDDGNPHRVDEGWQLCARMTVQFDTPTLHPATHDRFALLGEAFEYEVEIEVPRYYRGMHSRERDGSDGRTYLRGAGNPAIHIESRKKRSDRWKHPCRDYGRSVTWRVDEPNGFMVRCEDQGGHVEIERLLELGSDIVSCHVGFWASKTPEAEVLQEVCATMRVSPRPGAR